MNTDALVDSAVLMTEKTFTSQRLLPSVQVNTFHAVAVGDMQHMISFRI